MKRSIEDMHIAGYYSNAIMRCFAFSYCTGYDGRDGPISPWDWLRPDSRSIRQIGILTPELRP